MPYLSPSVAELSQTFAVATQKAAAKQAAILGCGNGRHAKKYMSVSGLQHAKLGVILR